MVSKRTRRDRDADRDLTVAEAAGVNTDETVIERLQRLRPSVYGKPTRTPKLTPRPR